MDKYREPLFRFIYRYVQNEQDAADLLQETFVRAYFNIKQFNPKARFVTWLYHIATNLCRDHFRKNRRRPLRQETFLGNLKEDERSIEKIPSKDRVDSDYQIQEEMLALEREVEKLPHDLRTALILVSLENRSYAEAADLLKTTEKAVETRIYRAKKILEQNLKVFFNPQ